MKNALLILLLSLSISICAQDVDATLTFSKPSEGKCMVYIARRSSVGLLIKFSIYDGETFLGKLGANKYFAYECDPGEHVFVAKSENTDYIEANLEAGRTYLIDAEVKMGIITARVGLASLNKTHKKYEKEKEKYLEFVIKKKGELLLKEDNATDDDEDIVENEDNSPSKHMRKFFEMKEKGKKIKTITPDLYID